MNEEASGLSNHGTLAAQTKAMDISRAYTKYMLEGFDCTQRNKAKAIGQFLTPSSIFEPLINAIAQVFSNDPHRRICVIDPFCGDGRLLVALLTKLSELNVLDSVEVYAWDIDSAMLAKAKKQIEDVGSRAPFSVIANVEIRDAFCCPDEYFGLFDVCVTNPPWSSTKSLKAHAFKTREEYDAYQQLAGKYGKLLLQRYPEASGKRTFGSGTINLSRFGMALSVRLIKDTGICGIVMPSSFTTDTSSASLRKSVFSKHSLVEMHYYPAELKLFESADQAAVSIVVRQSGSAATTPLVISHNGEGKSSYPITQSIHDYLVRNGHSIPLGYSLDEMKILARMTSMKSLEEAGVIKLGREVDETRISERLCQFSLYRFVKGFMVGNYSIDEDEKWYYNDGVAKIPSTALDEKVVWRDISRVSQRKRIKATLLPAGFVAGNSLGVATAENRLSLRVFLGILNSRVFEFMAGPILTTNHVSSGSIKRLPYPALNQKDAERLAELVDKMLESDGDMNVYDAIDLLVAKVYGLNENEYEAIKRRVAIDDLSVY